MPVIRPRRPVTFIFTSLLLWAASPCHALEPADVINFDTTRWALMDREIAMGPAGKARMAVMPGLVRACETRDASQVDYRFGDGLLAWDDSIGKEGVNAVLAQYGYTRATFEADYYQIVGARWLDNDSPNNPRLLYKINPTGDLKVPGGLELFTTHLSDVQHLHLIYDVFAEGDVLPAKITSNDPDKRLQQMKALCWDVLHEATARLDAQMAEFPAAVLETVWNAKTRDRNWTTSH